MVRNRWAEHRTPVYLRDLKPELVKSEKDKWLAHSLNEHTTARARKKIAKKILAALEKNTDIIIGYYCWDTEMMPDD